MANVDAVIGVDRNEVAVVEILRIHEGGVHVGEDLILGAHADIVAVARNPVGDLALANLLLLERLNHFVLAAHASDPLIRFDAHGNYLWDLDFFRFFGM